ncbi:hypothetical protein SAMN05444955_10195 [Lihuaxuella thermophila]|uniref:Uncharacterized protein n=1 Tax=Lihuaxuella thermophila TaxID=1173111 RepID=A0A1H8AEI2_9BACL|nr:hypothetical protein SAMN05444955_10195 [Lihuaxuella thermophila]
MAFFFSETSASYHDREVIAENDDYFLFIYFLE